MNAIQNIARPQEGEYAPYTINYIRLVPEDGQVLQHLEQQAAAFEALLRAQPAGTLTRPHAPGEWTVQDILLHLIDCERVFAYRALRIARADQTDLPEFEQNDYALSANANRRAIGDLLTEYRAVRAATLTLFNSFSDEDWTRAGTANRGPLTVRAALYIIAGHELHHLNSIHENYGI